MKLDQDYVYSLIEEYKQIYLDNRNFPKKNQTFINQRTPRQIQISNEVLEYSLPLLYKTAKKLISKNGENIRIKGKYKHFSLNYFANLLDIDELVNQASIHLIKNFHHFSRQKGKLSNFIVSQSAFGMIKYVDENFPSNVKMNHALRSKIKKIIFSNFSPQDSLNNIIENFEVDFQTASLYYYAALGHYINIDYLVSQEDSFQEFYLKDDSPNSRQDMVLDKKMLLSHILSILPSRDREIISERFGLESPKKTCQEIAKNFVLKRQRINQIEQESLEKMKKFALNYYSLINQKPNLEDMFS